MDRSPKDSEESSPAPQFKGISSLALSLFYCPALTSVHDYWKNHSFDYTDLCEQSDVNSGWKRNQIFQLVEKRLEDVVCQNETINQETRRHVILETGYSTEVTSEENSHDNDERKSQGDITWLRPSRVISQHWGRRTEDSRRDVSKKSDEINIGNIYTFDDGRKSLL